MVLDLRRLAAERVLSWGPGRRSEAVAPGASDEPCREAARTLGRPPERCRQLHARHGRTYYLATAAAAAPLEAAPRPPLYGFTRHADEIVRRPLLDPDGAGQRGRPGGLGERFFAGLRGQPCPDPILPAVLHTVRAFDLDGGRLRAVLTRWPWTCTPTATGPTRTSLGYMEGVGGA